MIAVAVVATFVFLQTAEAYPRGGSRSSFSSGAHFSAPRFSAPATHYSAPSRSFSNNAARFNSAARFSSAPRFHNRTYANAGPRASSAVTWRNTGYLDRARFSGNRTAAFNSRTYSRSNGQLTHGNRTIANRTRGLNGERVVGRYSANNWHRNWNRGRDHWWHGRRCHFHNGFWFIYDPFIYYPWAYSYYPYDGYYDSSYYDESAYSANEYAQAPDATQSEYAGDARVSEVQSALAREGYYDGAVDGTLGPATRNALRRYQRDHGLEATGGITSGVIRALRLR